MNLKKIKSTLPVQRIVIYLVVIGFLPLGLSMLHYFTKKREWAEVEQRLFFIQHIADTKARKQALNKTVRNTYQEADQFYLENQLDSLTFLKKEKESLEQLLKSPSFTGNEGAEKRYLHLFSNANRLQWVQGSPQSAEGIQQVATLLAHPVEIDTHDLKEILNRIEGNRKGKPQLIVTDFKLNKKSQVNENEVFELNIKLLKREFLQ